MSRTKRRKHVKPEEGWGTNGYFKSRGIKIPYNYKPGCYDWDESEFAPDPEHYKRYSKAKFQADTKPGFGWNGNVPASYRRFVNRIERSKDKQVTRNILKKGIYDEYLYTPWKSDAGYNYW